MDKRIKFALAGVLCIVVIASQARPQRPDNVDTFMRAKLKHSQKVLEGLTTENYNLIATNAQSMALLSEAAAWQVLQTPDYARRSAEFRHAAIRLKDAGKEGNLDAATLAYVEVTMKCVDCHKYVRVVRNARLRDFRPPHLDEPVRIGFAADELRKAE